MECTHKDEEAIVMCDGEKTCTHCGTMLGCVIDEGAEWRMNGDDEPTRSGCFTSDLLPESSYGSMMARRRGPQTPEQKLLAKLSAWCMASHGERSWIGIFDVITRTGTQAGLPRAILLEACGLFKQVPDAQKTRGESRRALMAGAVFTACSRQGATRSHEELAKLFQVSVRALCKSLPSYDSGLSSVLQTQLGLAERLCVELGATDAERDSILSRLMTMGELEHTPKTVVAGVAARVLGGSRDAMTRVSKASGVSVLSIRKMVEKV